MDSEIMDMIDQEIKRLPAKKRRKADRCRQYNDAKKLFFNRFTQHKDYEYFCKKAAEKYGI